MKLNLLEIVHVYIDLESVQRGSPLSRESCFDVEGFKKRSSRFSRILLLDSSFSLSFLYAHLACSRDAIHSYDTAY